MVKKFKKDQCAKCGKFFLFVNKMFKSKKGIRFVCMDCDEGESIK